jgi:hypothetical protein
MESTPKPRPGWMGRQHIRATNTALRELDAQASPAETVNRIFGRSTTNPREQNNPSTTQDSQAGP